MAVIPRKDASIVTRTLLLFEDTDDEPAGEESYKMRQFGNELNSSSPQYSTPQSKLSAYHLLIAFSDIRAKLPKATYHFPTFNLTILHPTCASGNDTSMRGDAGIVRFGVKCVNTYPCATPTDVSSSLADHEDRLSEDVMPSQCEAPERTGWYVPPMRKTWRRLLPLVRTFAKMLGMMFADIHAVPISCKAKLRTGASRVICAVV